MPTGKPQKTIYVPNPTDDLQVANKQYVDAQLHFDGLHTSLTDKEVAGVIDHADLSVTEAKIVNLAVTAAKIAAQAVTEAKIAAQAVTLAKMRNAVGSADLFIGYDGAGNIVAKASGGGLGDLEFLRGKQLAGDLLTSTGSTSAVGPVTITSIIPANLKTFYLAKSRLTTAEKGAAGPIVCQTQNDGVNKEEFSIEITVDRTTEHAGQLAGDSLIGDGARIYRMQKVTGVNLISCNGFLEGWVEDT